MLSASFLALFSIVAFILLIILIFRFFIFKKLSITFGEFKGSMAVYRIVKGNLQALQKEQSIFTRRAQSLWGKEMLSWPTFRIVFPIFFDKYAIFGIIVPDSFNCDKECLEELGFKFGKLDSLSFAAKIEVPTFFCYSLKLNQYRALKSFKSMLRNKHPLKAENDFNSQRGSENTTGLISDTYKVDVSIKKSNISIENPNSTSNDQFLNSDDRNNDEISNKHNEINNNEMVAQDNKTGNNQDDLNDQTANTHIEANNIKNGNDRSNYFQLCDNESETQILNQNQNKSSRDLDKLLESITDDPPFAEIRYKKKKRQIFLMPLMNYDKLVGLWKPVYYQD